MKQGMLLEGKYQIFEEIKHSSTGEVCLARAGNKYYAVKAVHRSDAALPTVLYTAQHPGLPHLEEVLEKGDEVIFIMDWISGSTLDQCLKETGVQPETLVLNWAVQLCDVLLYLHSLPVVHCDIKPSNILLRPDGRLVLIDLSAATTPGTLRKSAVNGTQGFAAPELYTGFADARTDIYALGQTLLVLLTGGIPESTALPTALRAVCRETFAQIILKCVQPLPDDRYPSCAELMQALKSCEADPAVSSRHTAFCPPTEERVTEKLVDTASALLPVLYPEADFEVVETLGFTSAAPLR